MTELFEVIMTIIMIIIRKIIMVKRISKSFCCTDISRKKQGEKRLKGILMNVFADEVFIFLVLTVKCVGIHVVKLP